LTALSQDRNNPRWLKVPFLATGWNTSALGSKLVRPQGIKNFNMIFANQTNQKKNTTQSATISGVAE
jgi:hypothetical protein